MHVLVLSRHMDGVSEERGRVVGWREAEWWDKGCRRGGWMAGAAAAVSSLTCAPAPCGLFPASSCGASRPQHPPLPGLKADWLAFSQPRSAASPLRFNAFYTQCTCPLWSGCRFSKIKGRIFQQTESSNPVLVEENAIFKEVAVTFDHIWPREIWGVLSCFPFQLWLL